VGVQRSVIVGAGLVAALAVGGLGYVFLRPSGPPPVVLGTPAPGSSVAARQSSAPGSSAATGGAGGETWTVDAAAGSFVGYRVEEQLASIGANTAVGRTSAITGGLTLAGSTITSVSITADLTQLASDDPRRDGQLSRRGLETSVFPTATFVLATPLELGSVPGDGATVRTTASGDLTLHGVTRRVAIDVAAARTGDAVTVTGTLGIVFADWGIEPPSGFIVLSIADHGTMEFSVVFRRG
jgi:polyisoprenoid-binding protein YceI